MSNMLVLDLYNMMGAGNSSSGHHENDYQELVPRMPTIKPAYRWAIRKQLVDKREVLYALALGAPVAILTSAAGLHIFPGAWAWVAGASVGVWILAASGMVINQYAVLDWEQLIARHLGRLGVLGAAVLFCFFAYRAFFPSVSWAFWILLAIAAGALGLPWILSCIRGDDVVSSGLESAGDAAGRAGKLETV